MSLLFMLAVSFHNHSSFSPGGAGLYVGAIISPEWRDGKARFSRLGAAGDKKSPRLGRGRGVYSMSTLMWSVPWASNSPMYCSIRSITSS